MLRLIKLWRYHFRNLILRHTLWAMHMLLHLKLNSKISMESGSGIEQNTFVILKVAIFLKLHSPHLTTLFQIVWKNLVKNFQWNSFKLSPFQRLVPCINFNQIELSRIASEFWCTINYRVFHNFVRGIELNF